MRRKSALSPTPPKRHAIILTDYPSWRNCPGPARPANYHLTFSRSEANEANCRRALAAGQNVTVVFRKPPFPTKFWGYPVIDGDQNDLRFLDPAPCIVALKAKGTGARRDTTGFVLSVEPDRCQGKEE